MEAAYGLAICVDMLITTSLLIMLMVQSKTRLAIILLFALVFFSIEGSFLISNAGKFVHGGWFSFILAAALFVMMFILYRARQLKAKSIEFEEIGQYVELLKAVQNDQNIPKESGHLVYMVKANDQYQIDKATIYSLFKKRPKRADIYWFLHVEILDEPFTKEYHVETIIPEKCFFVLLRFGFKVDHKVNLMFRKILQQMAEAQEISLVSQYPSLQAFNEPADFKFILIDSRISSDISMNAFDSFIFQGYNLIKKFSLPKDEDFGLENANVEWETVPVKIRPEVEIEITRV
jgi:KUP system potassium uptake protein